MANELQIFENSDFGSVRTVLIDKEPYFVGKDVCEAFDDKNYNRSLGRIDEEDKRREQITDSLGRKQEAVLINESGLYALLFAMQPQKANHDGVSDAYPIEVRERIEKLRRFKRWVTHDVIPAIRKTGSYSTMPSDKQAFKEQELRTRMLNARVRESNQYLKIAAQIDIPEYRYILQAKSAEALNNGVPVLPMQEVERKTYSATEIGSMFGVSAHKIGKLAKIHNLKTTEYGKWFYDKAAYSAKEVETWRYYESAIPVFEGIFGREAV
jgi:prophage antirepressor-like protein|nr:BRO family protein [uncultured Selenomonas sp.]DAV19485.1 MAG TPA: repressor domain protein [Caudoviricetes sp.]